MIFIGSFYKIKLTLRSVKKILLYVSISSKRLVNMLFYSNLGHTIHFNIDSSIQSRKKLQEYVMCKKYEDHCGSPNTNLRDSEMNLSPSKHASSSLFPLSSIIIFLLQKWKPYYSMRKN